MTILRALANWLWHTPPVQVKPGNFHLVLPTIYDDLIAKACALHHIRPTLLKALIWHESRFDPRAVGDGGRALGLCQMHREAATDVGAEWATLNQPGPAIAAGAAYLANQLKRFGSDVKGLMAYNQGPSVAERADPREAAYALGMKYAGTVLEIEKEIG